MGDQLYGKEHFYRERDRRTTEYLGDHTPWKTPTTIYAGNDACLTPAGQILLTTLANQLARVHRSVVFSLTSAGTPLLIRSVCGGSSLGEEILRTLRRIDPFGQFDIVGKDTSPVGVSIGAGHDCPVGLHWYIGYDRSIAELSHQGKSLGAGGPADFRGAGLAAVLGAAVATKTALNFESVPIRLSAWNLASGEMAEYGPDDSCQVDVGRVLMIGGGAVGAAVAYWLMHFGKTGPWTIIDADSVRLHNTNRSLLFFPDDAGWPGGSSRKKVKCLAEYLPSVIPIDRWYHQAPIFQRHYDTVLVLANEEDVRSLASRRNDPIQFQATTGYSWMSQLHRHIVGRDDCVQCRTGDIREPLLGCSEGGTATKTEPDRPDAALPFLSAASGLMLVSALAQLQRGQVGRCDTNTWRWDFRSTHRMTSKGQHECRDGCVMLQPHDVRKEVAKATRWRRQPWLTSWTS